MDWNTINALLQFGLTAFVTLIVVVDPFGVAPIFVAMTRGMEDAERREILNRAVSVAFGVALFFMVAGSAVLSYLGVSVNAFSISGGILLFVTALPMLFGERPRLQAPEPEERGAFGDEISIFPLAIPLLSGPGAIATILLLTNKAGTDIGHLGILAVAIALVYLIAMLSLRASDSILVRLGENRVHILTRVLGILLAALAVQFVLNGITGYYKTLQAP
jgi:multiple antibiotic resistance protein